MTFYQQQIDLIKSTILFQDHVYERLKLSKDFIESNLSNEIDVDQIAAKACFSKYHFIRVFKSAYGRTPNQYLIEQRIQKSKELLKLNKPIAETCYAIGFESKTYFSGLFKRATGLTPARWKSRNEK